MLFLKNTDALAATPNLKLIQKFGNFKYTYLLNYFEMSKRVNRNNLAKILHFY
jgi:hypothetical protein